MIEKCREGDQRAQFELYRLYYKAMYNVSLRIVNDEFDAEDIMQEAFLGAFNKMDTYQGEVSFGAWLKKIVINRSLDCLKKRKVKFEEVNEKTMELPDEGATHLNVNVDMLKRAIRQLSDGYRTVLSLYLLEGYDHDEIGDILNISSSTSRSQFTRAKAKLKEQLSKKR